MIGRAVRNAAVSWPRLIRSRSLCNWHIIAEMVRFRVVVSCGITNRVAFEICKTKHQIPAQPTGPLQVKAELLARVSEVTIVVSWIGLTKFRVVERECRDVTPCTTNLRKQLLAACRLSFLGLRQVSPLRDRQPARKTITAVISPTVSSSLTPS